MADSFLFRGVGVALVTPFQADGSIDYDALTRVVRRCLDEGVDYLVVNGTTGEASTIPMAEKAEVLAAVREINQGSVPLLYGIGQNDTRQVIELLAAQDYRGIDGVLTVTPYYNKPSQEGLYRHYMALADVCPVPLMLYNVPGRTGSNLEAKTTLRLAQHPRIVAIKEASGDMPQATAVLAHKPEDFELISGDDLLTIPLCSLGAAGSISVLANAFPGHFTAGVHAALENNYAEARTLMAAFVDLNPLLYEEGSPVGVKEVLAQQGICERAYRLPLVPASESLQARIRETLAAFAVLSPKA